MFESDTCTSCGSSVDDESLTTYDTLIDAGLFGFELQLRRNVENYCLDCYYEIPGDDE
jgi:hypothetical protein